MVVKVKLEGLNIVKARKRYYVYFRDGGEPLLKAFEGSRAELERRLSEPDLIAAYNVRRRRDLKHTYPEGTLGALIQWFENECPKYAKLADATKKDYSAAFLYLRPEFDAQVNTITQFDLYGVRDKCAKEKWGRFADKMMAALSSMFSQAVKRGKMTTNPAKGIDKAHAADPNSNREWSADEWKAAIERAPQAIKTPLMLARHAGFRGQTIAGLQWRQYQDDPSFGKCFRVTVRKNKHPTWIPATPELQAYLATLDRSLANIAVKSDGRPWDDEKKMQTAVSHFLRDLEKEGLIGEGTTLHGVRVSYAAGLSREGASTGDVAAALGDRSNRMGEHYTRHVESEAKVIRAFESKNKR